MPNHLSQLYAYILTFDFEIIIDVYAIIRNNIERFPYFYLVSFNGKFL